MSICQIEEIIDVVDLCLFDQWLAASRNVYVTSTLTGSERGVRALFSELGVPAFTNAQNAVHGKLDTLELM